MEGGSVWDRSCAESDLGVAGMVELELELALETSAGVRALTAKEGSVWDVESACPWNGVSYMTGSDLEAPSAGTTGVCTSSVSSGSSSPGSATLSKFGFLGAQAEEEREVDGDAVD